MAILRLLVDNKKGDGIQTARFLDSGVPGPSIDHQHIESAMNLIAPGEDQ
jgi:hypothetical protein